MPDCTSIDPLVTPYIDGELAASEREIVQQHLHACPPCLARVRAEEAVQRLLVERKTALHSEQASPQLRRKCGALAQMPTGAGRSVRMVAGARRWRDRLVPLALAATLVLIVGGAFVYQITARSPRVMAAELTADHLKCFAVNRLLGTHQTPEIVESALASGFGWQTSLPARPEQEGLALVGSRPCLYGEGRVAHIMYRHNGRPVSLFMLPRKQRAEVDETIRVLGHEAAIWSVGDRTFVLIAQEAQADVEHLAAFVRASMH
jgi:anti-sigma factor RsiW